ncbi:hypothetical protein K474DRAFT_1396052 [Panus rudis PR-1116 ss-1]|nr:hypothetical protein K474DRAFT_1396052 [Panus rudis PR-1116 ss-1]
MPKPTLIQTLLGRPSQSYHFPPERQYHSTKQDILRVASYYSASSEVDQAMALSSATTSTTLSSSASDVKHRAPSSSRTSPEPVNLANMLASHPPASAPSLKPPSSFKQPKATADAALSDDDTETDIFYTPRSSIVSSPRASRTSSAFSESKSSHKSSRAHKPPPLPIAPSISSSSSSSGPPDDLLSSASRGSSSTRLTTPVNSDRGSAGRKQTSPQLNRRKRLPNDSFRTIPTPDGVAEIVPASPPHKKTHRRTPSNHQQILTSASAAAAASRRNRRHAPGSSYPPAAPSAELRSRTTSSPRHSRSSKGSKRGRMSALVEEDETSSDDASAASEEEEPVTPAPEPSTEQPPPQSLPEPILNNGDVKGKAKAKEESSVASSSAPEPAPDAARVKSTVSSRRQSGKVAFAELEDDDLGALESPDARLKAYASSNKDQRRSYSDRRRLSRSFSIAPAAAISASLPTHVLPTPVPSSSSNGTAQNGYTGLTLPRAANPTKAKRPTDDGKVDLVREGVAQTSMATIEIVRGVAEAQMTTKPRGDKRLRKLSISLKFLGAVKARERTKEAETPAYLVDSLPLPVAFTAHISPPTYVPSSHILIQVHAVGLDAFDSLLVHGKVGHGAGGSGSKASKAVGYIPGRSLVGRVVQCGWEVTGDVCRKGDWVIALLSFRKSGALAEFVVVERHRVHRSPPPQFFPPPNGTSNHSNSRARSHVRSFSLPAPTLTSSSSSRLLAYGTLSSLSVEELALLPLCAVPAHRAVRTFEDVLSSRRSRAARLNGRLRAFITHGHDGPGAIAAQLLRHRNVGVTVQVPESVVREDVTPEQSQSPNHVSKRELLESRLKAWGVEEICVGEPLAVIQHLASEGRSFDLFLDTIGGVEVWERAQRLLLADPRKDTFVPPFSARSMMPMSPIVEEPSTATSASIPLPTTPTKLGPTHAHFTTLVGDSRTKAIPTAQDNIRSGFRSLRRAMSTSAGSAANGSASRATSPTPAPGGYESATSVEGHGPTASHRSLQKVPKRTVGYTWVSVASDVDFEGEDIRDSLSAVLDMVEKGWIRPPVSGIGDEEDAKNSRVVLFEKAPEVFRRNAAGPVGLLEDGGTCVVKIVG